MKYLLELRPLKKLTKPICNARGDASKILIEEGYKLFYFGFAGCQYNKLVRNIVKVLDFIRLFLTLKKDDTVFIQYPMVGKRDNALLYKIATPPRVKEFYMLVHDIDTLRGMSDLEDWNILFFSKATKIILHSEEMKKYVVDKGIEANKIRVLDCFDYLTQDPIKYERKKTKDVVFVGQLDKSSFLEQISPAKMGFHLNLYGRFEKNLGDSVTYKCKFRPDNVSVLEGSWGLVWNGDSIESCTGPMGEYLQYNSPHKVSLFVAAHLPIIIWDKAAKAEYVKSKGLGICVSSLRDISSRIDSISDEEYAQIIKNLEKEAASVRNGQKLRMCLK